MLFRSDRLMPLDQNDDDLVGAGELAPGTVYPGAAGTTLLRAGEALPATLDMVPFTVLPVDDPDAMWATAMVKRFPSLSALKLQAARTAPPGASWNMSIPSQGNGSRVLQTAHLRIDGWVTAGKALTSHATAKRSLAASFEKYCDARTRAESTNEHDLHWLVASADRDQSKVVEPNEFSEWMAVQERIVRGQVLLTIFDAGHGLFEIVDEDHDGALSQRELMTEIGRAHV